MYKGIVDDGVLVRWVKKLKHTISHGSSANLCASPHQPFLTPCFKSCTGHPITLL